MADFGASSWLPWLLGGGLNLAGGLLGGNTPIGENAVPLDIDIEPLVEAGIGDVRGLQGALTDRANRPVQTRSAFVQNPPSFSGGGLPLDIGVTGADPALLDSSLLELPGLGLPAPSLGRSGGGSFTRPGGARAVPGEGYTRGGTPSGEEPDRVAVPRSDAPSPTGGSPARPRVNPGQGYTQGGGGAGGGAQMRSGLSRPSLGTPQPVTSEDLIGTELDRASAAFQLLLAQQQGGG